ncbi:Arc family DNA-binding protein [Ectothiorhodospiraceae bacterium WFHF3C12]|nr:Arc family DNA-binding protein [Ectothiorhodospiraceae bacterium WFHF3C12]
MNDKTIQRLTIRIPEDLHEKVARAAEASGRSVNAEIMLRLKDSLAEPYTYAGKAGPALVRKDVLESDHIHPSNGLYLSEEEHRRFDAEVRRRVDQVLDEELPKRIREEVEREISRRSSSS